MNDPQLLARNMVVEIAAPDGGKPFLVAGNPIKISDMGDTLKDARAPLLDGNRQAILDWLDEGECSVKLIRGIRRPTAQSKVLIKFLGDESASIRYFNWFRHSGSAHRPFVWYSLRLTGKFSNLDKAAVKTNVSMLLIHGYNHETMNFSNAGDDVFAQFKKYIHSEDDFGVDFVFPIVGRNDGKKSRVLEICKNRNLHFELIETKDGWFFAFIQMSDGTAISNTAIDAALELVEFDFSNDTWVSENSTFKWRRKKEIFGRQELSSDDPSRYQIFSNEP